MDNVTTDTIIGWLQEQVEKRVPVPPNEWLDAALKLTVLVGGEHEKLFTLQQEVSKLKSECLTKGDTVAKAKVIVEASDVFKSMLTQKAKIDKIQEIVRISKIQARMSNDEIKSY